MNVGECRRRDLDSLADAAAERVQGFLSLVAFGARPDVSLGRGWAVSARWDLRRLLAPTCDLHGLRAFISRCCLL